MLKTVCFLLLLTCVIDVCSSKRSSLRFAGSLCGTNQKLVNTSSESTNTLSGII